MDFIVTVFAIGDSVGRIESKTLTLVQCDSTGNPIDNKSFHATDLNKTDLIFRDRPFNR